MLKYGGKILVEWMVILCYLAWRLREVPDKWKKVIILSLHRGKNNRDECNNYRGISLFGVWESFERD